MRSYYFQALFLGAVAFLALSSAPQIAYADPLTLEVSESQAVENGLKALIGKAVTLRLRSGEEMSGMLEAVGPAALRLGQLSGKEFFSALIRIEEIAAVIYRAR